MVQQEPNLTLTLEALGPSGAVLSTEVKAAMAHSLPLKCAELAVPSLRVWGRICARNGKDYIIARSSTIPVVQKEKLRRSSLYIFTQDGVSWSVLPEASEQQAAAASQIRELLVGDPQHKFFYPPKAAAADADAGVEEDVTAETVVRQEVTELRRLRAMVDAITAATNLAPVGSSVVATNNQVISNPVFAGLDYPDKLESYYHELDGPQGSTAADDVRGSWAVLHDNFKGVTICRSLLFLGYCFYYDGRSNCWGDFYHGDGLKNDDLIFML